MPTVSSTPPERGVVALIPAHDEAPRIAAVIRATLRHLPVLVVDDGSSDGTAAAAREAGATVLEQRPNRGKGAALQAGFARAIEDGAIAILTLDADGQHDPSEIPRFLHAWAADPPPDLVIGRRNFRTMPPLRRLSNDLGRAAFSWAVGRPIPDNQSGYRLVSRRLALAQLSSDEEGFAFEVEQITTCIRLDGTMAWVPIRTIYAGQPSHIRPIRHVREFARMVRRARREVREPLR
jgi:glycosyltransferase involved in cell wall biosynthesis